MPNYNRLMQMKRTAALVVALVLGTVVCIVSLFVDDPMAANATASADPIVQMDDTSHAPVPIHE